MTSTLHHRAKITLAALAALVLAMGCLSGVASATPATPAVAESATTFAAQFPTDFLFGIATAPAHSEDGLFDTWLELARDRERDAIKAWRNADRPEVRLNFWTDYKTEIDLSARLGVKIFRMGVDWGRLVPSRPVDTCPNLLTPCYGGVQDQEALAHYQEIVRYARAKGMSVMLTLFHHSVPRWLMDLTVDRQGQGSSGGWTNADAPDYFAAFARDVVVALRADVDLWVIHNEPAVFASLAYGIGIWPPAKGLNLSAFLDFGFYRGDLYRAFDHLIAAHRQVYDLIKELDHVATGDPATRAYGPAAVGIAHNVGYHTGETWVDQMAAAYMRVNMNEAFLDGVIDRLDFLGLNYYGEEHVRGGGVAPDPGREYSESGRGVNPTGFYLTLKSVYEHYFSKRPAIPIWITENGISDATDLLRPAYLVEHLMAVAAARADGLPIKGYVFWTISDNWEWADGYCPKFGLAAVDRSTPELRRTPRPSFELYGTIARSGQVTVAQREGAWQLLRQHVGESRPFCRSPDGAGSLDVPAARPLVDQDWRFQRPVAD